MLQSKRSQIPDALLMQTKGESRGCFLWLVLLYFAGAVFISSHASELAVEPLLWRHTVYADAASSAMELTVVATRTSPRIRVQLFVHAKG
eukprot:1806210-Prymnesium_polylepis.1